MTAMYEWVLRFERQPFDAVLIVPPADEAEFQQVIGVFAVGSTGGGSGGGLPDGDKGDIVVSGGGTTMNFDPSVVTAFAKTYLSATTAGAVRSTLGLGTAATAATGDFAPASHTHSIASITGLQAVLDGKAATGDAAAAVAAHEAAGDPHATYLNNARGDARYSALGHGHAISDVSGLSATLAVKADLVGGKVPTSQIPSAAMSEFLGDVASQAAMLALTGERGDWCIRTDVNRTYFLITDNASSIANWRYIETPGSPVTSVNGQTAIVVLGKGDVGLANVANIAPADMPISDATATALSGKEVAGAAAAAVAAHAGAPGVHPAAAISDLAAAVRAQVEAALTAGSNITITPAGSGGTRTLTLAAAGGGSSSTLGLMLALPRRLF